MLPTSEIYKFYRVETPTDLLPILESRLPKSCFMYNQIKKHKGFQENLAFYTIGTDVIETTWIISNYIRHDHGPSISISAPQPIVAGTEEISENIKHCFASPTNGVIDWDNGMWFVVLEKSISKMIFDISVNVKGNVTEVHPCNLYYVEMDVAARINVRTPPLIQVRRLNVEQKEENFFVSNWKYTLPGSDLDFKQSISVNPSGGVFLEGKCVAGVTSLGYGLLAALYTLKEHRKKGYGKLAMNFAFNECARDGCFPCLTVEQRNTRSIKFNEGLGVKLVAIGDWIKVCKLEVD